MHLRSLIAPFTDPVRRRLFPVPLPGNFTGFGRFPRFLGSLPGVGWRKFPVSRELPRPYRRRNASTASAAHPSPPSRSAARASDRHTNGSRIVVSLLCHSSSFIGVLAVTPPPSLRGVRVLPAGYLAPPQSADVEIPVGDAVVRRPLGQSFDGRLAARGEGQPVPLHGGRDAAVHRLRAGRSGCPTGSRSVRS